MRALLQAHDVVAHEVYGEDAVRVTPPSSTVNLVNVSITRMDSQPDPFLPEEIILDFQRTFVTLILSADAPFQQVLLFSSKP